MNILVVSQYYNPEQFQINDIAPALVKKGHKVTVLCGLPNYPQGKIYKGYCLGKRHEMINGVEIIRCTQFGRGSGKIGLMLNYLSYAVSASIKTVFMKKKYDVVVCYQLSPVTMAYPALVYKKLTGKKLFLYCLDIFPESVLSHGDRNGKVYKFFYHISRKIYNACDLIGVTSKPFVDYLYEVNDVPINRMTYIPQHADDEMINMDLDSEDNGITDFMFAGNIGFGQNLETVVEAASIIKNENFIIHMVGDGSRKEYLENLVKEKNVENKFVFHGKKSRNEMPNYYRMADVLLITLRGNNRVGETMPGKLQMYMTTGKPIVGAINGAAQQVITESRCGVCGPAGDAKLLAENMQMIMNSQSRWKEYGENARIYFNNHFTIERCIKNWEKVLEELRG